MTNWITLQETADKVGIRKGTLCMWRNRGKFPFKTKGKGRSLLVDEESVGKYISADTSKLEKSKKRAAKVSKKKTAPKKRGRKPNAVVAKKAVKTASKEIGKKKVGKKRGRKPGRPSNKVLKRTYTRKSEGCKIIVKGDLDLAILQQFIADIKSGSNVIATPSGKEGYVLSAVK